MNVTEIEDRFIHKALVDTRFLAWARADITRLNRRRNQFEISQDRFQFTIVEMWIKYNRMGRP